MSVPTPSMRHPGPRPLLGAVLVALVVVACGATTVPTPAPSLAPALATPVATAVATLVASPTPAASLASLHLVWQKGGPVTDMTSTVASAIDPVTGNLWVAVPFDNLYWIMAPDGTYLESWGTAGTADGQFDFSDHAQTPDGFGAIAFAPDGSFYVGDTGNHRVEAFDKQRRFVRAWGTFGAGDGQFNQIVSLATDGTTVYVGDGGRSDISEFDRNGTFVRSFGGSEGFAFVALDAHGGLHATNPQNSTGAPNTMAVFGPDGKVRSQTDLSAWGGRPFALSVDAAGMTYVSPELADFPFTGIAIVEIDPSGRVTRTWSGGGDVATVAPAGDAIYVSLGQQLVPDGFWTYVRKYAIPKP